MINIKQAFLLPLILATNLSFSDNLTREELEQKSLVELDILIKEKEEECQSAKNVFSENKKCVDELSKKCDELKKSCDKDRIFDDIANSEACKKLVNVSLQGKKQCKKAERAGKKFLKINSELSFLLEYTIERNKKAYKK